MITLNERNIYTNPKQSFKAGSTAFITKAADLFIKSQENLSSTRFIQDTATNWLPKAIFSRSKADFAEMSFLEFIESGIFYFASPILGEKFFRNKIFKNIQPKPLRNIINQQIPNKLDDILKNNGLQDEVKKRTIATKAGIVLACTIVPVAEYTLSFAKNLFTLKTFHKSNFNNIANLDKTHNENEDLFQQNKVEKNSKKQLKKAAIISLFGMAAGITLALTGHKSDKLQNVSKAILEPGKTLANTAEKFSFKSKKSGQLLSKFSLDFANNNGKLALSKGQLALTAILGLFGYSKAAQDRGKLDVAEVWTRVPLVVFYTIVGSELFEKGFTNLLKKKNAFPDIFVKTDNGALAVPKREQLPVIAKKIAKEKNTDISKELSRLTKEKAFISLVPYVFSLLFMGFTLSAVTRFFTQYRYNKQHKNIITNDKEINIYNHMLHEVFKDFKL